MPFFLRVLLVLILLLAAAIGLAWQGPAGGWQAPAAVPPEPASLEPIAMDPPAVPRENSLAMLERPLFDPARGLGREGHDADAPGPAPDAADPLAAMQLLGLARSPQGGVAIVRIDGHARQMRPGERIGRWTLSELSAAAVRFVDDDGRERELPLQHARQPAPPVAGPALPANRAVRQVIIPQRREAADAAAAAEDDPILTKSFEQRVAERRAMREAMEKRLGR